jgi:polysaccharide export outer membrane protein
MSAIVLRIVATASMACLIGGCSTVEQAPVGDAAYAVVPADAQPVDYALHAGDVLRVTIYHEPGLSLEDAEIAATGDLRLPLAGDVPVSGLTTAQASDAIAERLQRYVVRPQVTLFVKKAVGRRVTMDGEVQTPGLYPVDGQLTLMQAIAQAGGPSRVAKLDEVVVIRGVDGERMAARFDLGAIRKGEAPDPLILPGDRIIIGLSALKMALGITLRTAPALAAGFVALDGR